MNKLMTLCVGMVAMSFSSCGGKKEKELQAKETELEERLEAKRDQLNEVVRNVDKLKTEDFSGQLVDLDLKIDAMTRELELEKSEQKALSAEAEEFVKKLEDYRKKYSLNGN